MSCRDGYVRLRLSLSLLAVLTFLTCPACALSTQQNSPEGGSPAQEQTDTSEESARQDESSTVLQLASLLSSPADAYERLSDAGLTWTAHGNQQFAIEAFHDAMTDTEASHPVFDALSLVGAEQPAVGEDYFVGPGSVCLGVGLAPSQSDALSGREVLSPDDVTSGTATPDSISLSAPLSSPLTSEQLGDLLTAAGLSGEGQSFRFDDTSGTGILTEAQVGTVTVGGIDRVWYVRQSGSVAQGGSFALLMGIVPVDVARNVVESSELRSLEQIGSWDDAATPEEHLRLFATAVAQDALVGGGASWMSVVTGELYVWDSTSKGWSASAMG